MSKRCKETKQRYYQENKTEVLRKNKKYRQKNKEKLKAKASEWISANKDKVRKCQREYQRTKNKKDRTEHILGCTLEEFIEFLEVGCLLTYGKLPEEIGTMGIDHIIPLYRAETEDHKKKSVHDLKEYWRSKI